MIQTTLCLLSILGYYLIVKNIRWAYLTFILQNSLAFILIGQYYMIINLIFCTIFYFKERKKLLSLNEGIQKWNEFKNQLVVLQTIKEIKENSNIQMPISPIEDGNTDFSLVYIDNKTNTPHCKKHGAMNKVSFFKEGGYWRCCQSDGIICRAGCNQIKN